MKKIVYILIVVFSISWPLALRGEGQTETQLKGLLEEVSLEVSSTRGLQFKTPVKMGIKDKKDLRAYLEKLLEEEIPQEKLLAYQKALVKFGLIPKELPLGQLLVELYTEEVSGFYDWRTKTLYLIVETPANLLRMVVSHELTHALQDQYVGIENLPTNRKEDDDCILAAQALLEGDAISVMMDYMLRPIGQDSAKLPDLGPAIQKVTGLISGRLMSTAPAYLQYNMLFPYLHGLVFVQRLRQAGAWPQVDTALKDPPRSTEQILHPDKYLVERDNPVSIKLPLLQEKLGPQWVFLDENVMGEFNTKVLLSLFLEGDPAELASGWDGDLYQVYEERPSGRVALVWFTTWDTSQDAREFFEGYRGVLKRKYDSSGTEVGPQSLLFPGQEDTAYMEYRDQDVLVLEGAPEGTLGPVMDSAWRATKAEKFAHFYPPQMETK